MFVIEYDPINNCQMASVWNLFIDSGDMADIFGIRVEVQVIPLRGEQDPYSITKQCRYCKHHVNYSYKVRYIQHKTILNLDHPVTLAMTDRLCLPHRVLMLCQEYLI